MLLLGAEKRVCPHACDGSRACSRVVVRLNAPW
jgi:hypothetical protein